MAKAGRSSKKKTEDAASPPAKPKGSAKPAKSATKSKRNQGIKLAATSTKDAVAAVVGAEVYAWEDDPISGPAAGPGVNPVIRPEPKLLADGLNLVISGPKAPPADKYPIGSAEFRYWAAAEALARGRDFWQGLLSTGLTWQPGASLQVHLNAGVELNASYDRRGLWFYSDTVGGKTVYSGESPDILCHELGHAVLDAARPQLWDANYDEVAAFHESFGDISALLSALQLPSMRKEVLAETGGRLYRSSRLSRLAEQVGWAIRQISPDQAESDCLRNSVNTLFYRDPATLPANGPVTSLSSEPHSFSRVFTSAFFEAMASMLVVQAPANPGEDDLLAVSQDAGRLILAAVQTASIEPGYYSQVAAAMIAAGQGAPWKGRFREALQSAFVRHGILSLESAAQVAPPRNTRSLGVAKEKAALGGRTSSSWVQFDGMSLGLGGIKLMVEAHEERQSAMVFSAAVGPGPSRSPARGDAVSSFVTDLFRRGRVEHGEQGDPAVRIMHPLTFKTHCPESEGDHLKLRRLRFGCGFCV